MKHPMQPILPPDENGIVRFQANAIIRHLFNNGTIDLNLIGRLPFDNDDRTQLAQLIGYSVSGFGDLSYVDRTTVAAADAMVANPTIDERDARIKYLEETLSQVKASLRTTDSELYDISLDDPN